MSQPEPPADESSGDGDGDAVAKLARELRALHGATGRTLKELESHLHVSDSSLSRYLSAQAVASWTVVRQLCELAGRDPDSLRPLWEQARTTRRPSRWRGPSAPEPAAQPPDAQPPDVQARTAPRRRRRLVLGAAVVLTAALFGGAGVLVGRHLTTPRVVLLMPTEDQDCATWPWPADIGQDGEPEARAVAANHTLRIRLMVGRTSSGRPGVWAQIDGARFGDRVWLDETTNSGASWKQCGPFPTTTGSRTSRAHDLVAGAQFRACGDVPQGLRVPGRRGENCTSFG
jgi:transcriptional regulator with XRE-family HTH domain